MSEDAIVDASFAELEPSAPPQPALHPQLETHSAKRRGRFEFDPKLVLDPRARFAVSSSSSSSTAPGFKFESDDEKPRPFAHPILNSSLAVKAQLERLHSLNLSENVRDIKLPSKEVKQVQAKLSRTLNASTKQSEFSDLPSLSKSTASSAILKRVQRAKISVDEAWKAAKELKPMDLNAKNYEDLEPEVVSIPFPKLCYKLNSLNPSSSSAPLRSPLKGFNSVATNVNKQTLNLPIKHDKYLVHNLVLSISSLALNFEDSHCFDYFETPLRVQDFK